MIRLRSTLALGAFFVLPFVLAACGGGKSQPTVVKVGSVGIKRATFDHWMQVAAASSQQQQVPGQKAPKVNIPVPPDFKACIAEKAKTAPKPAKGQPKQTDAQFKAQCKQEYEGLRDQVLSFLISAEWIQGEAHDQDVHVTDLDVKKQFDKTKKQSFPKDKDFQNFLKQSGMSVEDLLFRVKLDQLSTKLRTKITKGKDKVTDAQIQQYYNKNKQRFAQPERRDLRIVLTKTEDKANQAKKALQGGQSWKTVAKKFSIDQASKDQGGVLLALAKGQQEKALDDAVFKAPKNKLTGPVKTQFGFYIFTVTKVTPSSQQTLDESKATIKSLLASQNQQDALKKFVDTFRKKWIAKTDCKSGFVTDDCKNAPKKKKGATTVPPGTGTPQPAPANGGG